jgi:hypothetical protein
MSNFLARCAAIGLVGGGFAATGDLGWLAARGMRLINARTVPSEQPATPAADQAAAATATDQERAGLAPRASAPLRGPAPRPPIEHTPPAGGPAQVELAALRAGDRLTCWARAAAAGQPTSLAFDIVDPATGEALLLAPGMAARRVTIHPAGDLRGTIATGSAILVTPAGPSRHTATFGPITAITVSRRSSR